MRLARFLWMGRGQPPAEYVDLILCRDVYHCTATALDEQDATRVAGHLACLGIEGQVQKARSRKKK